MYNKVRKQGDKMLVELIHIDFNSDEAIYMQLRNQIILGIATSRIQEGETLPSVRQLADIIGINMHTVNKAYSVLKQDGFVSIDRRKGAVVCIDANKILALSELKDELRVALAKGWCKNISKEEVHVLIDEIFKEYC
jgi:GntR family transcriptional regulator